MARTIAVDQDYFPAGSEGQTLVIDLVSGDPFVATCVARWGATSLATTFVSPTQLTAFVPASLLAAAGTFVLSVTNG